MNRLSRRQFLRASGTVVGATIVPSLALSHRVGAAEKALIPKKMPFPPNDEFGSYEPTITPDGNTIYFARFAGSGDKRVLGTTTDIFVTHRIRQSGEWPGTGADWTPPERLPDTVNSESIDQEPRITPDGNTIYFARFAGSGDKRVLGTTTDIFVTHRIRQSGEWPGTGADWTPPERLPDTVNSDSIDQEPRITPDGKTLYFMSRRSGNADIWVTHKQPNGEWAKAQSLTINTPATEHCFMPLGLPGADDTSVFVSVRPREAGATPTADLFTTRMEKGVWQPARRYESKLLDSIGLKCRLNAVSRDGLVLGVVSVHDFGKFHTMQFVHYDPASREWKGPIVPAPFNNPAIDGACPMFTAGGDKMIWSAGYDRGPGPVSTSGGTGSTYDLFWLNTSDIVAYYKAKAGPS